MRKESQSDVVSRTAVRYLLDTQLEPPSGQRTTPDKYVLSVLAKYSVATGPGSTAYHAAQRLYPIILKWASNNLLGLSLSGSYAKGTAIRGRTEVDLFISLSHKTPEDSRDIYMKLARFLTLNGLSPRQQDVSIGIISRGASVDLVPGKKQEGKTTDHSLYRRRVNTWTQTNVDWHTKLIQNCCRRDEIRAIKVWRELHGLDFPSFYLELTVIRALSGQPKNQLSANILKVLGYLATAFRMARVVDPANPANVISDDLTAQEKERIETQASDSLAKPDWDQIIW